MMTKGDVKKGSVVYYARVLPTVGIYDLCELKIRTVTDNYFCGADKRDKHAYLFGYNSLNTTIFNNRADCLTKVKDAQENAPKEVNYEKEYEEY